MSEEHYNKYFVVQKGKAFCDKGSRSPHFKVNSHQKHYWNDSNGESEYLAVTEEDTAFTPMNAPFGNCTLKNGQPCCFVVLGKWTKVYDKVKILGKSCITECSELQCSVGGKIKVLDHGQREELSIHNFTNGNIMIHNQINPLVDLEEFMDSLDDDICV